MNQYGQQAMEHWRNHLPISYQQLRDPMAHFTALGERAAAEIDRRALELEEAASESFLANLQNLNTARQTAQSQVIQEMILIEPETTPTTNSPNSESPLA